jgi:Ni/Co efflux regulator RcnB
MKRTLLTAVAVVMTVAAPAAFAQPGRGDFHRHNEWRKGYHMQHNDWARGRQVDWRSRKLRQPPRGYEWREVDGNYVMAAVATGIIASVIANSR